MKTLPIILLALTASPALAADPCIRDGAETRAINHANLFIEDDAGDGDIGVHGYFDDNGGSRPNIDVHVGPDTTSFVIPAAFFDPASRYEIEVVAIEESGNQTIGGASFFATE